MALAERTLNKGMLAPGEYIGEYVVIRCLGEGGCGSVYEGEHRVSGRRAAIKILHKELAGSPKMIMRFFREAEAVNRIKHPNIVEIYEVGTQLDGRPYLVMELLDGVNVRQLLAQRGRLLPEEVASLIKGLCSALHACHQAGFVHRDLKASNLMVAADLKDIKLLDFGIAKLLEPEHTSGTGLTSIGRKLGSPQSMAPEQFTGAEIDARTDVYALGVLMFSLLTGRSPFVSDNPAELELMHIQAAPPRPSQFIPLPPAIDQVILRCLAKSPDQRYESALACFAALSTAVHQTPAAEKHIYPAFGIYIEAKLPKERQWDDNVLDALLSAWDTAETMLRNAGYTIPLITSAALLAVSRLTGDERQQLTQRREACAMALQLRDLLDACLENTVAVAIVMHTDNVHIHGNSEEPSAGPLLQIEDWATPIAGDVCATAAAMAGIDDQPITRIN